MMKIKICGITNYQDASAAVKLGIDALGFIFARSPRRIAPEKAKEIIALLPPFVKTVGVFVNEDPSAIRHIMSFCSLDLIQLHGEESPEFALEFMPYVIKAFRLKDESSLQSIKPYCGKVRAILFDTYSKKKRGGTGETFDWDLAVKGKEMGVPVILSGGLTPSNIEQAISLVRPYALDVNSGVEDAPGKKNPPLIQRLMETVEKMDPGGFVND
ncbi:MAG: phosphoribosylanthranilate isomerase [Desulfobacterales bacterium]|nr:phosphoribosylanthranilate isomerase [Desulfobacterales bacterium]